MTQTTPPREMIDHAELAGLAEAAKRVRRDSIGRIDGIDAHRRWDAFGAAANPATVLALLAEIASLRAERRSIVSHATMGGTAGDGLSVNEISVRITALRNEMHTRSTEAERKLAEADEENTRWLFRMADIREASGIGVKPMLGEVPGALRAMRERLAEAVLVLTGIAKGEVPPEQHGHYLAHRQAVKAARTFLSKEALDDR